MRHLAQFHGHIVKYFTKIMFVYRTSKNSLNAIMKMKAIMKIGPGISVWENV